MPAPESDALINIRFPQEQKATIQAAAEELGKSTSDFALDTLLSDSDRILQGQQVTRLTPRDTEHFKSILANTASEPNASLVEAASRYKVQVT